MSWELLAPYLVYGAAALGVAAVAFAVGRRTSPDGVRVGELELSLEDLRKEHEIALSELEAAKHEFRRTQRELADYRENVEDHFSGTGELLRDLTKQYRQVFEHVSQGATLLCPDRAPALDATFQAAALPSETPEPSTPSEAAPASDSEGPAR